MSMDGHYYIVGLPDGTEENVVSNGWSNVSDALVLFDANAQEVRRFEAGQWTSVRPMPVPEGEVR